MRSYHHHDCDVDVSTKKIKKKPRYRSNKYAPGKRT